MGTCGTGSISTGVFFNSSTLKVHYNSSTGKVLYGNKITGCQTGYSGYDSCCALNAGGDWPSIGCVRLHVSGVKTCTTAFDFTADAATDLITAPWHTLSNGDTTAFTTTNTLPAPLQFGTNYYVVDMVSFGKFKLATTLGGPAINLTTAGTGTHTLSCSEFITALSDNVYCLGSEDPCEYDANIHYGLFYARVDASDNNVLVTIRKKSVLALGDTVFQYYSACAALPMTDLLNDLAVGNCGDAFRDGYDGFVSLYDPN